MAINSRDRRFSMLGLGAPIPRALPSVAGSFDAAGRAMLLYLYHGIDVGEAVVVDIPTLAAIVYGPNPTATLGGD